MAGASDISDIDDPNKYIVGRSDFCRVPRWPNDGIEAIRAKFRSGDYENFDSLPSTNIIQLKLTELLGGWMYEERFEDMDPHNQDVAISLPFATQISHAKESENVVLAAQHLQDSREKPKVKRLLKQIGCKGLLKAQAGRFPGIVSFLNPLAQAGKASDRNLNLLFGEVSRVRGTMMEIGCMIVAPPEHGSPAQKMMDHVASAGALPRVCASCGRSDMKIKLCVCRKAGYCGKTCQRSGWALHHPVCLEARGKPVPEGVQAKADAAKAALAAKHQAEALAKVAMERNEMAQIYREFNLLPRGYIAHLRDFSAKLRRVDLPWAASMVEAEIGEELGLKVVDTMNLIALPEGMKMPDGRSLARGMYYTNPDTRGVVVVMHTYLFEGPTGEGQHNGCGLDGIFVLDSVRGEGPAATPVYRLVAPPAGYTGKSMSPSERFRAYLRKAKSEATLASRHPGEVWMFDSKRHKNKAPHSMESSLDQFGMASVSRMW